MMYIVYKTICIVTGQEYIGIHRTNDINTFDGYLGSGDWRSENTKYWVQRNNPGKNSLGEAIRLHGRNNFTRETLFMYKTLNEARDKERELVTPQYVKSVKTLNLVEGGGYPPNILGERSPNKSLHKRAKTSGDNNYSRKRMTAEQQHLIHNPSLYYDKYHVKGKLSFGQIAKKFGCSKRFVIKLFQKHKLKSQFTLQEVNERKRRLGNDNPTRKHLTPIQLDVVNNPKKYYDEYHLQKHLPFDRISKELGFSTSLIGQLFRKNHLINLHFNKTGPK